MSWELFLLVARNERQKTRNGRKIPQKGARTKSVPLISCSWINTRIFQQVYSPHTRSRRKYICAILFVKNWRCLHLAILNNFLYFLLVLYQGIIKKIHTRGQEVKSNTEKNADIKKQSTARPEVLTTGINMFCRKKKYKKYIISSKTVILPNEIQDAYTWLFVFQVMLFFICMNTSLSVVLYLVIINYHFHARNI